VVPTSQPTGSTTARDAVRTTRATTFDLFGTLVAVDPPAEPAVAIADGLAARGISVPDDWREAYAEVHLDLPPGRELPLPAHVRYALASRGCDAPAGVVDVAVRSAFDVLIRTRPDAASAVAAAADRGPVGLLSNCSVPGLAVRAMERSEIDTEQFDGVVTSVGCGWRKPHRRSFGTVAEQIGVSLGDLLHVGDDPTTDDPTSGVDGAPDRTAGKVTTLLVDDVPLAELATTLEGAPR
jgi:FMN phosphatase YigB (HAD superfamily)